MDVSFDPAKRDATLANRGLDYAEIEDDRRDYGEQRYITAGYLDGRMVVMVWTPRGNTRRIISMRYAHEREAEHWRRQMG